MQGIKPTGNRVLLERLDGDGREETLASGLIVPAFDRSLRQGNAKHVPDTFRARVLAISDGATKATSEGLRVGDEVLVHTFEQTNERTLAGDETPYGLLVDVENILGVCEATDPLADSLDLAAYVASEKSGAPPVSILDLGFHRRSGS